MIFLSVWLLITLTGCRVEEQARKIGALVTPDGESPGATSQIPEEIIYEVGDIISINDAILVVLGWDQPPGGDFNPQMKARNIWQ